MQQLTDVLFVTALIGSLLWLAALVCQVVDLVNSFASLASARDGQPAARGLYRNVWSLAALVVLSLVLLAGTQLVVRLWLDAFAPVAAIVVLLVLALLACLAGLGIVVGLVRGDGLSYSVLRSHLTDDASARLKSTDVAVFRVQLAQVDSRRRHIRFGLRDRAGLRAVRVRLDAIADGFAVVPPTGFAAIEPVRWRTANAYLWIGNPFRVVPGAVAFLLFVDVLVLVLREPGGEALIGWAVAAVVATVASLALALLEARVALAGKAAWHAVYQRQRLDVLRLIEELERASRKGVAGLGERVTKALQILRDQQG